MAASPQPVCLAQDIRRLEAAAQRADPAARLMERAGLAAARVATTMLEGRGRTVLVVAGPGNNGGDAFEVAVHLQRDGAEVRVVFAGEPARLAPDAARALDKWRAAGGELLAEIPPNRTFDLVIDGLFGIGLTRPVDGRPAALIAAMNALAAPVLALDVPSGIDADTGMVRGSAVRATRTLTFIALKPGLLTLDGPDHVGDLECDPIGIDAVALVAALGSLVDDTICARGPVRPRNFHKGNAGTVAILGGAAGMTGAALLAGRAALHAGAGKVFVGMLADPPPAIDPAHPELMIRAADALPPADELQALAVGPGMGTEALAQRLLAQALRSTLPLVLDADALNLVATYSTLEHALAARAAPTLLTPHPGEASRLLGRSTREVQADRVAAALALARRFRAHALLKGNGSVIADPSGTWAIVASGNPGMASGGMGDVLAGVAGALLAQGLDAPLALRLAAYVHGAAADRCVARGIGPIGLTASEVIPEVRALINQRS